MLFLFSFLFIQYSLSTAMECIQDMKCIILLKFDEDISSIYKNSRHCARKQARSCFVGLSLDFTAKQAIILFDRSKHLYNTPLKLDDDLLKINTTALILRRYTVFIRNHPTFSIGVHIALECEDGDYCTIIALRRYWPRFTSIQRRQNSFLKLSQLFNSNLSSSSVDSCFIETENETEICSKNTTNNSCFASINGSRYCIDNNSSQNFDFVYSFNQVDYGYTLTDENIFYSLVCHSNNCNNNETIYEV